MRRLIFPILLLLAIGGPIWTVFKPNLTNWFYAQVQGSGLQNQNSASNVAQPNGPISVYSQASYSNPAPDLNGPATNNRFRSTSGMPSMSRPPVSSYIAPPNFQVTPGINGMSVPPAVSGMPGIPGAPIVSAEEFNAMGGQTIVFPGNALAPDVSAQPLEFVPTMNFADIFRFDVFPNWVKNRWERVSTSPGERGLHGLRVAVVTGTNTSDLHGSMTYFFDASQRCQRITFRGWTGDSSKLIELLVKNYGFRAQPTHWAGLYTSQRQNVATGALALKHPTVISRDNPAQQIAFVLEMNNPKGPFPLSNSFSSIVASATQSR